MMGLQCDCENWLTYWQRIEGYFILAWTHGIEYNGEHFKYCPWCAKELKEEK